MDLEVIDLEIDNKMVIFDKDNFKFTRNKYNDYTLEFVIENNNIEVPKIIDFNLMKLIYSLNTDIFEKINLVKIDNNNALITMLIKNFFEDVGLPQYYCNIHVAKNIQDKYVLFQATSNQNKPEEIPIDSKQMNICKLITTCNIINEHIVTIHTNIVFDKQNEIPLFIEKMVGLILNKIFKRLKQFIENLIL